MSKNDAYFKKLGKIKKVVTYESSRKKLDKDRRIVETLQEKSEEVRELENKVEELMHNFDTLQIRYGVLESTIKELENIKYKQSSTIEELQKELTKYKLLAQKNVEVHSYLDKAVECLKFYAEGKHVQEGFMGIKVIDSGETAEETLAKITPKNNSETTK